MSDYLTRLTAADQALSSAWAEQHGPWPERKPGEPRPWPPHPTPPCFDCWSTEQHRSVDMNAPADVAQVARATVRYEGDQGTVLLCERHWRKRHRDYGYTDAEIRTVLIGAGYSEAEADAMLTEDTVTNGDTRR